MRILTYFIIGMSLWNNYATWCLPSYRLLIITTNEPAHYLDRSAASHAGGIAATLDYCSNPTVDKEHASFYLTPGKLNAGGIFWTINKMVLAAHSRMRAVMINTVYFSSPLSVYLNSSKTIVQINNKTAIKES